MDENEAHDGCVESGNIAAVRVVAPLIVAALNAVCSVDQLRDLDLRGAKFLRVGLPNGKIAVRKFTLEGGFNRREALVVLDIQGLVETTYVFFAQAIRTFPRCQCNAEGTGIGPAGGSRRVLEDRVQDVLRNLLIRVCAGRAARGRERGEVKCTEIASVGCHCSRVACLRQLEPVSMGVRSVCCLFQCALHPHDAPRAFPALLSHEIALSSPSHLTHEVTERHRL